MSDDPNLERAYALKSLDDTKALYRDWAETYDQSFAKALGYASPQKIAEIYLEEEPEPADVLDVGAGTGLLAAHLKGRTVDAVDISPEMLKVAAAKKHYRHTIIGDLTGTLDIPDETYGGIVSSGTFTHGHVGPVCLPELLRVAKPQALFCCSINLEVFDKAGFGSALAGLVAEARITPVQFMAFPLYKNATHEHADDTGLAMLFRKLHKK